MQLKYYINPWYSSVVVLQRFGAQGRFLRAAWGCGCSPVRVGLGKETAMQPLQALGLQCCVLASQSMPYHDDVVMVLFSPLLLAGAGWRNPATCQARARSSPARPPRTSCVP